MLKISVNDDAFQEPWLHCMLHHKRKLNWISFSKTNCYY